MRCDKCAASGRWFKLLLGLQHDGCGGTWRKFDPRDEVCRCADHESSKCPHWTVARVRVAR
jgi:hypothetical protein